MMMTQVTTTEQLANVDVGTKVEVSYESKKAARGNTQTVEARVVSLDNQTCDLEGEYGWTTVMLEEDPEDLCRKRLKGQPGDSFTLEYRSTTRQGAKWSKLSRVGSVDVEVLEE